MSDPINNERFRKLLLSLPGKAIAVLYDSYFHSLVSISKKFTHHHEASVDIVQDAIIHVWEKHKRLGSHHDHSIQHYLVKVVRNKSISYYYENLRTEEGIRHLYGNSMDQIENPIEANMIRTEIRMEIRNLIATFPRRERECLLMKIDGELTQVQIADRLNITQKAVERSITSAYKRLRYFLKKAH